MVLCETKIFGIPNILTGLDFVSMSKGGAIFIYDDNPETIAKESIKILNNYFYRKKLGKEARESMKKFDNKKTIKKWIKLILAVYKGEEYFNILRRERKPINLKDHLNITKIQVNLINMRVPFLKNLTIPILLNFTKISNMVE